jgi:hypothetical protein
MKNFIISIGVIFTVAELWIRENGVSAEMSMYHRAGVH